MLVRTRLAQVHAIDYDQTPFGTMCNTSSRALAAIANSNGMRMRRWEFVVTCLQGDLEHDEISTAMRHPGKPTPS
eukprot:6194961-Pleurochrysis_carterae.AAC.2